MQLTATQCTPVRFRPAPPSLQFVRTDPIARVMELVDIGDLKSPDRKIVPVQVRPRAPLTFLPYPALSSFILLFNDLALIR
jgi:hypothetical protein